MVVLKPGHVVGRCAKGEGVGLGKHVLSIEFFEYLLGHVSGNAPLTGSLKELFPVKSDQRLVMLTAEGPAELVGLKGSESGYVPRHMVHLILEEDNPQGPLQGPLFQWVVVVPWNALGAPLYELGDTVVDADSGADRSYLVGHVGEVDGSDAGDGLHLGRRLHLEYSDGVGLVHHSVDCLVVKVDAAQVDVVTVPLLDKLKAFLHLRQRP